MGRRSPAEPEGWRNEAQPEDWKIMVEAGRRLTKVEHEAQGSTVESSGSEGAWRQGEAKG